MSQEKFYIPKHLDDSARLLLWPIDEALSFILPMIFGLIMNLGLIGVICSFLSIFLWRRAKGVGGLSFLKSLIYWYYGSKVLGLKNTPDSAIKNYIG